MISCGFWPGSGPIQGPAFYSYCVPAPEGLDQQTIHPGRAFYSGELGEFILLYDEMRRAGSPDATLLEFLQSTYDVSANLAKWDRAELERPTPPHQQSQ